LYDRPPYVADLLVTNAGQDRRVEVRLIVVHLKSKRGDEAENEGRRTQQARHVAHLLQSELEAGAKAIALGDFNDDLGSVPLQAFRESVNLYRRYAPPGDRYSYIYNGRAQAVDHIIMTPEMDRYFLLGGAVHVNADYAEPLPGLDGRTSDHDPVVARFRFEPTGISAALIGAASGGIGTGYHQPRRLK
jgi:predicted extracellular nuclease